MESKELITVLNSQYNFSSNNITYIENPTRQQIIRALEEYKTTLNESDNLLIFYSGHGEYHEENRRAGYWIPVNGEPTSTTNWVSNGEVQDKIAGIPAKNILVVADACYSGALFVSGMKSASINDPLEISNTKAKVALTAGAIQATPSKSIFAKYLIETLRDNNNTFITSNEIYKIIKDPIYEETLKLEGVIDDFTANKPQWGVIESESMDGDFIFVKSNKLTTESFDFGANEEEFSGEELFWGLLGLSFLGMPIIILILFVLVVVLGIILIVRRKK